MNSDDSLNNSESSDNSKDFHSSEIVEGFLTFKDLYRILYNEGNFMSIYLTENFKN